MLPSLSEDALASKLTSSGAEPPVVLPVKEAVGAKLLGSFPPTMIVTFYRLANPVALARGFDPDKSPHRHEVTATR